MFQQLKQNWTSSIKQLPEIVRSHDPICTFQGQTFGNFILLFWISVSINDLMTFFLSSWWGTRRLSVSNFVWRNILMQIHFGILQSGIRTSHVGQEALFTIPLCLCNSFWLSLTVYLLNPSVLRWFECLRGPDMLPAAASLWLSGWCFRSPGIWLVT